MPLTAEQLTGRDESHLEWRDRIALQPACWAAFDRLRELAAAEGIDLRIASGFRSFDRQLAIWNAKAAGERPVHDDQGEFIDMKALGEEQRLHAILRYSALPGASRHHWGTDLDVYDAAAVPADYQLQLTPQEYADAGVFGRLHLWLEQQLAQDAADFSRPYAEDHGGVAPERWHLSYQPAAAECCEQFSQAMLQEALESCELALSGSVFQYLPEIFARYVSLPAR
jgi:LAS superfamily LD-carboxypeptidase LdcB